MNQTDKNGSTISEMIKVDLYKQMKRTWAKLFFIWVSAEVAVAIVVYIATIPSISGYLQPFSPVGGVDFPMIASNLFTTTITVNGIIIGFASVCAFFYLDWINGRIDMLREEMIQFSDAERDRQEKESPSAISSATYERLKQYRLRFWDLWTGASKYVKLYSEISLLVIILQVTFFVSETVSGFFVILTSILSINSLVAVATGLYPLLCRVCWQPPEQ
jgi:hypothetical protein